MLAAEKGHFDICKLLIEHGADPDRKTPGNKTAADLAAVNGHNDIVQLLAQFSQPPASVEEDSFEFWLSENTWEEDELPAIPPAQDAKLIKQAEEQEFQFSRFIPAVDGEDWTDIDLELPDVQLFEQNRKRSRLGSEYTDRVKDVIFHARQTGLVNIFRLKEEFGEHPSGEHLVDRLCEVLSGYDVLTDEYMPNLFDELFREDSSREEFFHDDAIDREICQAEDRSRQLYQVANSYTEDALRRTEEAIQAALDEVRESRVRYRSASAEQMQACQEKLKADPVKPSSEE